MCGLLIVAGLIALTPLFSVLTYVLSNGYSNLSLGFFTHLPRPIGESGGGMANALVGTHILVGHASEIGVGWVVTAGVYLSEYGETKTAAVTRFGTDMLASGVPSIVVGLFVYEAMVVPMKRFSALAGGVALGNLAIPTVARNTGRNDAARAGSHP